MEELLRCKTVQEALRFLEKDDKRTLQETLEMCQIPAPSYQEEKKAEYVAALSGAASAASRGYIDDIIEPDATRKRVIAAIQMLLSKEEMRPYKKHGTI